MMEGREAGGGSHPVEELRDEAAGAARRAGDELRGGADRAVQEGTNRMAERSEAVAEALRSAGEALRGRDESGLGRLAEDAAGQVRRFGRYLREHEAGEFLRDLEDLGRRHTGAFLGGGFVSGLAAGRFLRSSRPDGEGDRDGGDGGADEYDGGTGGSGRHRDTVSVTAPPNEHTVPAEGAYAERGEAGTGTRAEERTDLSGGAS